MLDITAPAATPEMTAAGIESSERGLPSRAAFRYPAADHAARAIVLCDDLAAIVAARDEPEVKRAQDRLCARPGERARLSSAAAGR